MEEVSYGGWSRCARLVAGGVEILVTLEVGPRVIRFGRVGGPNMLVEYDKDMGKTGGDEYRSYGGHRLWTAPEDKVRTYEADNHAVVYSEKDGWHEFRTPVGPQKIEKAIRLFPDSENERVVLEHELTNRGDQPIEVAPWVLTVMAAGGECLFPQAPYLPHTEELLPARPLVLWHYTKMQDPRWTWGDRVVRLRQTTDSTPQKAGAMIQQGWAAYSLHGDLFLKRFPYEPGGAYLDFGCNFETFTRNDMLEVESLGTLASLAPGSSVTYRETWYLVRDVNVPSEDSECADLLEKLVESRPLVS